MDAVIVTAVTALAAGAATIAQGLASAAGEDLYIHLKQLLRDKYDRISSFIDAVEADPSSDAEQEVLAKQLVRAGAARDKEVANASQDLLDAIRQLQGRPEADALFDFEQLRVARNVQLENIEAFRLFRVRGNAEIEGDLVARNIRQQKNS